MNCVALLLCLTAAEIPIVQVDTLAEKQLQGTLDSLTSDSAVIMMDRESVAVPISEVLFIRSTSTMESPHRENELAVRFVDDSRLSFEKLTSAGGFFTAAHALLGEIRFPVSSVSSIRMSVADPKIDAEWNQLIERSTKKDMIAIRKGDLLDHLDGVVGSLTESNLQFQLDGDDISVKREKIFGLIFARRESTAKKRTATLELSSGEKISVRQIEWDGTRWHARLISGMELDLAPAILRSIDFSHSKVAYLSDLEPRSVKHTPFFDYPGVVVWKYQKDQAFEGLPIFLGKQEYKKGLALHSQTQLRYRLGGEFRRFQATMGIGDEISQGNANVIVKGDERVIFSGSAKTSEQGENGVVQRPQPQRLDLDVTGVVELEIFVGFGSDNLANTDIGDRVYFGNARLIR